MKRNARRWAIPLSGLALSLAACAPVKAPVPEAARIEVPDAWRTSLPTDRILQDDWWKLFGDPALVRLVDAALRHNTDIQIAALRVDEAREQIQLARSALLPQVDAVVAAQRSRELGTTGLSRPRVVQPGLQVSYEVDVWGRLRNARAATAVQFEATEADLGVVNLAVASTMARSYFSLLALDRQLLVTRRTMRSREGALRIAQDRADLGYTSQLELTQAQSEYEAAAQLVPELLHSIALQENSIRLLTGELPGPVPRADVEQPTKIAPPPAALPSELLRRRPDIVQAERQLLASDINLDVARARFMPQVQLSANLGRLYVNALDYDPITVWTLGTSVLAPLFNGGQLRAGVNIATAQRDQAAYAYRARVLNAFTEVEAALSGVVQLVAQSERATARRDILLRSLEIARDRYRGGYSSYLEELDAQRNLFNVELAAIQIRESQINATVDLYQALGGGWQPRDAAIPQALSTKGGRAEGF